jgi:hypothetical protein
MPHGTGSQQEFGEIELPAHHQRWEERGDAIRRKSKPSRVPSTLSGRTSRRRSRPLATPRSIDSGSSRLDLRAQ